MEKLKSRNILMIITYAIILYMLFNNLTAVWISLEAGFAIILPFLYGLCIAYVLNIPYQFFRTKVFGIGGKGSMVGITGKVQSGKDDDKKNQVDKNEENDVVNEKKDGGVPGWIDPVSLIATYATVLLTVILVLWFILPQLGSSINLLIQNIPSYMTSLVALAEAWIANLNLTGLLGNQNDSIWTSLLGQSGAVLGNYLQNFINGILGWTSGLYNWAIGFVFSIYLLAGKDKLLVHFQMMLHAFLPPKWMGVLMERSGLANRIFTGFVKGSLIDSMIVGALCFAGTSALGIPYAILVSVVQGVANIIPVFGPLIGATISGFIILMVAPVKALIYVIFIIVLQQLDGNIIQPRIIGDTIGLPGLWVLFAITVGSGLFGVAGLIFGVPATAFLYAMLRETVHHRLKENRI